MMALYGEMEKGVCPNTIQPFLENIARTSRTTEAGSLFSISRPSPKRPIISRGDGSYLGVPCRRVVLGLLEWEGGGKL